MFYEVLCKCAYNKDYFVPISFPIASTCPREAARMARELPSVKKTQNDAVLDVVEIDAKRFRKLRRANDMDNYLNCRSAKEQRQIEGLEYRLVKESNQNFYYSVDERISSGNNRVKESIATNARYERIFSNSRYERIAKNSRYESNVSNSRYENNVSNSTYEKIDRIENKINLIKSRNNVQKRRQYGYCAVEEVTNMSSWN